MADVLLGAGVFWMPMRILVPILLAFFLGACSSSSVKPSDQGKPVAKGTELEEQRNADAFFEEADGPLHLVFDATGAWAQIIATGSAEIREDSPAGQETALMVASMRAKRSVAEFLRNDIKSAKSLSRIAKAYSRRYQTSDQAFPEAGSSASSDDEEPEAPPVDTHSEKTHRANRIAATVVERISDNTAAILRGVYVSSWKVRDDRIVVYLTASKVSIGAAGNISRMMSGAMQ